MRSRPPCTDMGARPSPYRNQIPCQSILFFTTPSYPRDLKHLHFLPVEFQATPTNTICTPLVQNCIFLTYFKSRPPSPIGRFPDGAGGIDVAVATAHKDTGIGTGQILRMDPGIHHGLLGHLQEQSHIGIHFFSPCLAWTLKKEGQTDPFQVPGPPGGQSILGSPPARIR